MSNHVVKNNQNQIMEQILDYVYQRIPLVRLKYRILESKSDLDFLYQTEHYVAPNYVGFTYLLVFTRQKDNYFSFFIDRKTLKYNRQDVDIKKVIIKPIRLRAHINIYDGTILDGVLIKGKKLYMITDVYHLAGQNMINDNLRYKLNVMKNYLKNNIQQDPKFSNCELAVENIKEYHELKNLVKHDIPQLSYRTRGLIFYPKVSGIKVIYTTDEEVIKDVNEDENKEADKSSDTPEKTAYYEVKKTDSPDVYTMYLYDAVNKKLVKQGIAYIPTKEISLYCLNAFNKSKKTSIIMKCKYVDKFKKWMPFLYDPEKNKPDKIKTIA